MFADEPVDVDDVISPYCESLFQRGGVNTSGSEVRTPRRHSDAGIHMRFWVRIVFRWTRDDTARRGGGKGDTPRITGKHHVTFTSSVDAARPQGRAGCAETLKVCQGAFVLPFAVARCPRTATRTRPSRRTPATLPWATGPRPSSADGWTSCRRRGTFALCSCSRGVKESTGRVRVLH